MNPRQWERKDFYHDTTLEILGSTFTRDML